MLTWAHLLAFTQPTWVRTTMNHADSPCTGPGLAQQDSIMMSKKDFFLENSIRVGVVSWHLGETVLVEWTAARRAKKRNPLSVAVHAREPAEMLLCQRAGEPCHPFIRSNWMPTEAVITNPSQASQAHLSLFSITVRVLIITGALLSLG